MEWNTSAFNRYLWYQDIDLRNVCTNSLCQCWNYLQLASSALSGQEKENELQAFLLNTGK